jgi:hypothetical protein
MERLNSAPAIEALIIASLGIPETIIIDHSFDFVAC